MYQDKAKVTNVVDGDTPEIFHPTYDNEREQGIAAKELAEKFLLDRDVTIQTHKKGKYGAVFVLY